MKKLVTLWKRPSYDGKSFTYYLLYNENGKRRQKSLGHVDRARQASQKAMKSIFVANLLQVLFEAENKKVLPTQVFDSTRLISVRAGSSVGRATD